MTMFGWVLAIALPMLEIGPGLDAQSTRAPTKLTTPQKLATRLVRFLELPDRRGDATTELLRMGKDSVSALVRGLDHPEEEIVIACMHMLRELGPIAWRAATR
jgi:hypothetical protein